MKSPATRDSSRASSIQCSATFSYALLMGGSVACVARCLASSAVPRQASLSDDIRGGSSNAPNGEEKPRRSGAKGICGRRVFGLPQRDNSERGDWFHKETGSLSFSCCVIRPAPHRTKPQKRCVVGWSSAPFPP